MKKENGKRLAGGNSKPNKVKKPKKPSILTKEQKILLVIAIVLAVAVLAE